MSGKQTIFSGEFLQKKISEFTTEENLDKLYISKEVKALLKKNYKIVEIRKLLSVDDKVVQMPSTSIVESIEKEHMTRYRVTENSTIVSEFDYNKTDEDVEKFITTHIINS